MTDHPPSWGPATRRDADRRLLLLARGDPRVLALAVVAVLGALCATVLPTVLGHTIDRVLAGHRNTTTGAPLLGLVIVQVSCESAAVLLQGLVTAGATSTLRGGLARQLLALRPWAPRRFTAGEVVTRMVGNTSEAAAGLPSAIWAVSAMIPAVGSVLALALIDPWLAATFLATAPPLVWALRRFVRDNSQLSAEYFQAQSSVAARLLDALAGSRTIAAAGTRPREVERILRPLRTMRAAGLGMWRSQGRVAAHSAVLGPALQVTVLGVAGLELVNGRISLGDLVAAGQYAAIGMGLGAPIAFLGRLGRARVASRRLSQLHGEAVFGYGTRPLPPGRGRLEFRGVRATSTSGASLYDIDLVVPAGALVAVVGGAGSGRSLLAALAGRLVDPDRGQLMLDGVGLDQLDRAQLRRAIAYGFGEPVLLGETVGGAIGFGLPAADQRRVARAAEAARADLFIHRLPAGYQTRLADTRLSGGELQRLGLARCFAQGERVLLLDDATCGVDNVTQSQIERSLTGSLSGRTRLVVAGRVSTAASADQVVWLEQGRIRAVGTHQLLWRQEAYRALFGPVPDTELEWAPSVGEGTA